MSETRSGFDQMMEGRYPMQNPERNRVDFSQVEAWASDYAVSQQERTYIDALSVYQFLRQQEQFAHELSRKGAIPIGREADSTVISLHPSDNVILITEEKDPVAEQVLRSVADAAHWLHRHDPMNSTVLGSLNRAYRSFDPWRNQVLHPENASAVRSIVQSGNEALLQVGGYSDARTGIIDLVGQSINANPAEIASGVMQGGIETAAGFMPLVGSHNTILLGDMQPVELAENVGLSLNFLFEQLQQTPAAYMAKDVAGLVMHMRVSDLLGRQRSKWIEAMNGILRRAKTGVLISNLALRKMQEIHNQTGWNMRPFYGAFEALKDTRRPPSPNGFHMVVDNAQATPVTPFEIQ